MELEEGPEQSGTVEEKKSSYYSDEAGTTTDKCQVPGKITVTFKDNLTFSSDFDSGKGNFISYSRIGSNNGLIDLSLVKVILITLSDMFCFYFCFTHACLYILFSKSF